MEIPIKRALISVSDKTGLLPLAWSLAEHSVAMFSTGGTRRHLEEAGLTVHDISEYTGFPEMMDGRLKTLHPKVFGGILARHSRSDDLDGLKAHGIQVFELVVVNLYPFEQTISASGVTDAEAIEQIDIGGPSLVRAAAKNHAFITIATDPSQYATIAEQLMAHGGTDLPTRRSLAAAAFERTASYDRAIADYFANPQPAMMEDPVADATAGSPFPARLTRVWQQQATLRYGENPHQRAALYRDESAAAPNLLSAEQINGKELSYNNYLDLDAAWSIVRGMSEPAVAVMKHNNPCGIACGETIATATSRALAGDPVSAFGSILGCNRTVDERMAESLCEPGLFIEALIAPDFSPAAIKILTTKPKWKNNVRLMRLGSLPPAATVLEFRQIDGGLLVQDADDRPDPYSAWSIVTEKQPSDDQIRELKFAWQVVRHVKSNAIVLTRDQSLVGAGAGQMSRVDSVEISIQKAGDRGCGSVLASDAFFPFPDSIHRAAAAGITAIIQPGGSKNDAEVIAACNQVGLSMMMTGRRHFRH